MAEPMAVLDPAENELDRLTAELFDFDIRTLQVPMACSNHTNDGCSASCPSVGCTGTCRNCRN